MEFILSHQLRQLPKIELHRHMDCSVRWSTMAELAPTLGIEWPEDIHAQKDEFLVTQPMKDLATVLKKFTNMQKIYTTESILERIAFEACEDAFNDGVVILELRYAPTFIRETHEYMSYQQIHDAIYRGIQKAMLRYSMTVGLLATIQRIKSYELAEEVLHFALENKDTLLGLDLADNEDGFDPKKFTPIFEKAKSEGLHVTIHSGESPNPEAARWVRDSIEILGAERIGHGIQIINNPEVLKFVVQQRIPLEVCPLSNWLTNCFESMAAHPIRRLQDQGVLITINSDDPGVFASTLTDEYEILHRVHNYGIADIQKFNQNSYNASFIPEDQKQAFKKYFFTE